MLPSNDPDDRFIISLVDWALKYIKWFEDRFYAKEIVTPDITYPTMREFIDGVFKDDADPDSFNLGFTDGPGVDQAIKQVPPPVLLLEEPEEK